MDKKCAVMSGGGLKGAYQSGVLRQLSIKGLSPDIIYGTSIGAINGAIYSCHGAKYLYDLWLSIKSRSEFLKYNWSFFVLRGDGLYSMEPLRKVLDEYIDGNFRCIVEACRVNVNTGSAEYVSSNDVTLKNFIDAVQDSGTIPLAMQPRDIYLDGGVREVVPLERAINDGYKDITVILNNPWEKNPWNAWDFKSKSKWLRFYYLLERAVDDIMNMEVLYNDLNAIRHKVTEDMNIKVYMPKKYLYDTLEVNPVKIKKALEEGMNAEPTDFKDLFKDE